MANTTEKPSGETHNEPANTFSEFSVIRFLEEPDVEHWIEWEITPGKGGVPKRHWVVEKETE